jgi:hypothetical protein
MKLEILDAEDKGNKIALKMNYDWEFAAAVAKACGLNYASEEDVEEFIITVLENITANDLRKLGYEIDE